MKKFRLFFSVFVISTFFLTSCGASQTPQVKVSSQEKLVSTPTLPEVRIELPSDSQETSTPFPTEPPAPLEVIHPNLFSTQPLPTNPQSSAEAYAMLTQVQTLVSLGVLSTDQGQYQGLPDFDLSNALMNYYDLSLTGQEASDFVVRADASWESASQSANWWNSGCGFVFRMNAQGDHYFALIGMDGWLYLYRNQDHNLTLIGRGQYGKESTSTGEANVTLAAEGNHISMLIDNQLVLSLKDSTFSTGLFGYALASGTNKDFGTRCQMKNAGLWIIK